MTPSGSALWPYELKATVVMEAVQEGKRPSVPSLTRWPLACLRWEKPGQGSRAWSGGKVTVPGWAGEVPTAPPCQNSLRVQLPRLAQNQLLGVPSGRGFWCEADGLV